MEKLISATLKIGNSSLQLENCMLVIYHN